MNPATGRPSNLVRYRICGAYAVEIKRRESIGEAVVHEAEEKVARLKVRRESSVYAVLVYEGRLSKRVEADGFFARTISAESLLGRESLLASDALARS